MDKDETKEILKDFIIESSEILEELENDLVSLERKKDDIELLNKIFRAVHTIKGSSSFLELDKISTISHHAEDILNKLRKEEMTVTDEIMTMLLEYVDLAKGIIRDLKSGEDTVNVDSFLSKIDAVKSGEVAGGSEKKEESISPSESLANKSARNVSSQVKAASQAIEQTIRVEVVRLDALMNLVGELVLSRNRLVQLAGDLREKYEDDPKVEQLVDTTSQLGLITTELQLAVMKTRMVPISKVFNRFPRVIRDLAKELQKEVELVMTGEDTELDKSIIELITDPLLHMVRNAVDHGIESPEVREKKGKSRRGTIWLNASQEGNHIVIEVKDDGRGIDENDIIKVALEKELLTKEELARMERTEILGLIFRPGFSTAKQVTNVSGRGVGLDVVKSNIEKINGIISIDTKLEEGTSLQLRLPLTLAIIQSILVEVSGEIFAIPLVSIIESIKIMENDIHNLEGREVLNYRTGVLSLIRIADVFNLETTYNDYMYVVVIAVAEKQVGFVVDKLIGQEEIVIKSLGDYLSGLIGLAGATIMGDGRVRLIIDPTGIIEIAAKMPRKIKKKKAHVEETTKKEAINVLYVDDSATDRRIVRSLLDSTGWINLTEVSSGKDAIEVVKHDDFDIIIVDLIMPEIDGYAVAKSLRESGFSKPLIAITVKGEITDEKQLKLSGFDKLVLKPINLDEMLNIIDELLSKSHSI